MSLGRSSIQVFHHSMGLTSVSVVAEHEVFWGEIAPTEHLVHLYSNEKAFGDLLERFVAGGLLTYESVIVIATEAHLTALNERLVARGINLHTARENDPARHQTLV